MINNWLKYTWKRVRRIQFFYTIISKYSHNNVYACCPIFYQEIEIRFKLQYQSKYTNYKINYVIYKPSIHPGNKQSSRGAHCNPRASRKIIIAKSQWLITPSALSGIERKTLHLLESPSIYFRENNGVG